MRPADVEAVVRAGLGTVTFVTIVVTSAIVLAVTAFRYIDALVGQIRNWFAQQTSFAGDALDSLAASVFKGIVGIGPIAGSIIDYVKARRESQTTAVTKWASSASFALIWPDRGALWWRSSRSIPPDVRNHRPSPEGLARLTLDVLATMSAGYGLYTLFKQFAGEDFLDAARGVLVSITDSVEKGITILGFFGTTKEDGVNLASGKYWG